MRDQITIDRELDDVAAACRKLDPKGSSTALVLRETFDQLYDGQRTGRYRVDQLYKTEKTHCGTLVEINLQRAFEFRDGKDMDFQIAGVDVDCKYSQRKNGWMIPPEAHDHLCLVVWAEDTAEPKWSMGLVRATERNLAQGEGNRDGKKALSKEGQQAIVWLFEDFPLPPNVLLQLDQAAVEKILAQKSGQKKVNDIFQLALCKRVSRAVIATVGKQADYMKRIRGNGGARSALKSKGIIILGQYGSHVEIARALEVPEPGRGESVAVQITPAGGPGLGVAEINGGFWRVAKPGDPVVTAPILPKPKRSS